jgi:choline dehydrogenase-like flavoprotein
MAQSQVHENDDSPVTPIEEFTTTPFDFIICGGGTAGLAIAARLSENPSVNVGIVEAGKYRIGDPLIDTPATFMQMFEDPEYDWCLFTAPQTANNGKVHHIPRGKVLGGSSAINYLMYVRGSLQDYDDWAALVGDEGWSAASMKAYMRKHQARKSLANPAHEISLTLPFVDPRTGQSRVQAGSISHRPRAPRYDRSHPNELQRVKSAHRNRLCQGLRRDGEPAKHAH